MSEICATKVFQALALIFDPWWSSKVKFDDANRKPVGPTYKCSPGSNVVSVTVFKIFRVKVLTVHLLTLVVLTTEPKIAKRGDDLLSTKIYHTTKFQPDRANVVWDMRYQIFSLFGPWGLTPVPKFTKRGNDLADSEIYHPAKFHRSMPTLARDIHSFIDLSELSELR